MSDPLTRPTAAGALQPATRPSVIQLVFREKGALYAAYMPMVSDGGLFVPTTREYRLGDDIYLLLSLPDDPQRYPVAGRVACHLLDQLNADPGNLFRRIGLMRDAKATALEEAEPPDVPLSDTL